MFCWGEITRNETHKLIFQTGFWGLGTGQLHVGVLVKVLWWGFVWDAAVNLCARRHHRCGSVIRVPPPEKRRGTTVYSSSHGQGTSLHPSTATSQREEKRVGTSSSCWVQDTFLLSGALFRFEVSVFPPASLFAIPLYINLYPLFTAKWIGARSGEIFRLGQALDEQLPPPVLPVPFHPSLLLEVPLPPPPSGSSLSFHLEIWD